METETGFSEKDYFEAIHLHMKAIGNMLEVVSDLFKFKSNKRMDALQREIGDLKKEIARLRGVGLESGTDKDAECLGKKKGGSFRDECREAFGKLTIRAYEDFSVFGRGSTIPRYIHSTVKGEYDINEILARWINADPKKRMPIFGLKNFAVRKILCNDMNVRLAYVNKDVPSVIPNLFSEDEYERVIDGFVDWYNRPYYNTMWNATH